MSSCSTSGEYLTFEPRYSENQRHTNVSPDEQRAFFARRSSRQRQLGVRFFMWLSENPQEEANIALVPKTDNKWYSLDLGQAKNIIQGFLKTNPKPFVSQRIEWSQLAQYLCQSTKFEYTPFFNMIELETAKFVMDHDLASGIIWLQTVTPLFFEGAEFAITVLPAEDEEERLLALKIYGDYSASEFAERRHNICNAMLERGHKNLYEIISIFQRRTKSRGREVVSWYSSLLAL